MNKYQSRSTFERLIVSKPIHANNTEKITKQASNSAKKIISASKADCCIDSSAVIAVIYSISMQQATIELLAKNSINIKITPEISSIVTKTDFDRKACVKKLIYITICR